jgi:hypothetical protein
MKTSESPPVKVRAGALREGEGTLLVDVEVESLAAVSLLVVEEVRRIEWDPVGRTVEIWLADRPRANDGRRLCQVVPLPKMRELPAGGRVSLLVSVPRQLWRLTPRAGGEASVEQADLSRAVAVVVHLVVAQTPFYPKPHGPPAHEQIASWGQLFSVTARR